MTEQRSFNQVLSRANSLLNQFGALLELRDIISGAKDAQHVLDNASAMLEKIADDKDKRQADILRLQKEIADLEALRSQRVQEADALLPVIEDRSRQVKSLETRLENLRKYVMQGG